MIEIPKSHLLANMLMIAIRFAARPTPDGTPMTSHEAGIAARQWTAVIADWTVEQCDAAEAWAYTVYVDGKQQPTPPHVQALLDAKADA